MKETAHISSDRIEDGWNRRVDTLEESRPSRGNTSIAGHNRGEESSAA